ncbi:MAG: hypothetical protein FIB01_05685, partial [Gemmatimonadetes bacterium]|nr:hypothetical protein [Gemmatimonadota bacterium]
ALLLPRDLDGERRWAAAVLVERAAVGEFRERAADLGSAHPELTIAVTGPWPPYDFIRVSR